MRDKSNVQIGEEMFNNVYNNYYKKKPSVFFAKHYSAGITYSQLFTRHCSLGRRKSAGN